MGPLTLQPDNHLETPSKNQITMCCFQRSFSCSLGTVSKWLSGCNVRGIRCNQFNKLPLLPVSLLFLLMAQQLFPFSHSSIIDRLRFIFLGFGEEMLHASVTAYSTSNPPDPFPPPPPPPTAPSGVADITRA